MEAARNSCGRVLKVEGFVWQNMVVCVTQLFMLLLLWVWQVLGAQEAAVRAVPQVKSKWQTMEMCCGCLNMAGSFAR